MKIINIEKLILYVVDKEIIYKIKSITKDFFKFIFKKCL